MIYNPHTESNVLRSLNGASAEDFGIVGDTELQTTRNCRNPKGIIVTLSFKKIGQLVSTTSVG
jgi:hypothetical protein